jgi:hypothetical protein
MTLPLSILDLAPLRPGQTVGDIEARLRSVELLAESVGQSRAA